MRPFHYLILTLSIAFLTARAGDTKPPEPAKIDTKAVAILRSALDYLSKANTYSVTLTHKSTEDKKLVGTSKYEVSAERPNKLALVIKDGKLRCAVIADGRTLCTYSPELKKYAQHESPATIGELFEIPEMELIHEDLHSLLFLDQFNMTDAFGKIMEGAQSLALDPSETVGGVKAYRLHFSLETRDWYLWIQEGPQPLVRKVAVEGDQKRRQATVHVVNETDFDDWKVNEPIAKDRFTFTPPADSKKVAELVKHPPNPMLLVGQPAPPVKLKLLDGGVVDLASYKGKNVVVLDFWATWCGPCRMAMPVISEVTGTYKDKGLIAYAVNLGQDAETVGTFKKATPALTMPVLLDEDTEVAKAYLIATIPMTVIIDKAGIVQRVHKDVPLDMEILRKMLREEFDTVLSGGSLLKPPEKK